MGRYETSRYYQTIRIYPHKWTQNSLLCELMEFTWSQWSLAVKRNYQDKEKPFALVNSSPLILPAAPGGFTIYYYIVSRSIFLVEKNQGIWIKFNIRQKPGQVISTNSDSFQKDLPKLMLIVNKGRKTRIQNQFSCFDIVLLLWKM